MCVPEVSDSDSASTRLTLANPLHAFLSVSTIGVKERTTQPNSLRAESQGFDDVCAGPDTTVHHDLDLLE